MTHLARGGLGRRRQGRLIALVMLFALVWTQLAVAAFACPMLLEKIVVAAPAQHDSPTAGLARADDDCMGQGSLAPDCQGLCVEHCRQGHQNVDQGHPLPVAQAPAIHYLVVAPPVVRQAFSRPAAPGLFARALSPPKAIAHCCFRL